AANRLSLPHMMRLRWRSKSWTLAGNGRPARRRSTFSIVRRRERRRERPPQGRIVMIIFSAGHLLLARTIATLSLVVSRPAAQPPPDSPEAPPPWAQGRPETAIWGQSRAHRAAPTTNNHRQITYREAQGTQGFQDRGLCKRCRECAYLAPRRQGHCIRQHAPSGQGLRHQRAGWQTRGQDAVLGPLSAERPRVCQRHPLHRRAREDIEG